MDRKKTNKTIREKNNRAEFVLCLESDTPPKLLTNQPKAGCHSHPSKILKTKVKHKETKNSKNSPITRSFVSNIKQEIKLNVQCKPKDIRLAPKAKAVSSKELIGVSFWLLIRFFIE